MPGSWLNCAHRRPVFRPPGTGTCGHASRHGPYGEAARSGARALRPPARTELRDLPGRHLDLSRLLGIEHTAVDQPAHAARAALAWAEKVDARQPPGIDLDPDFLTSLAPAGLPRCLSIGFHLPAGDRPTRFVGRPQDQQPSGRVEDERAGRCRDPRDLIRRLFHQTTDTTPAGRVPAARHLQPEAAPRRPGTE